MYRRESKFFEIDEVFNSDIIDIRIDQYLLRGIKPIITLCKSPTGNCQLCCIANIEYLLDYILPTKQSIILKQIIRVMLYYISKRLILLDVHQNIANQVIKLFEPFCEKIISRTPYDSTNRSRMEIIMVQLKNQKIRKY